MVDADIRDHDSQAAKTVSQLIKNARAVQSFFSIADQATVDAAVAGAAWAILEPSRNRRLAEQAVLDTELGNVDDKIRKNYRKTLGLLQDLRDVKTVGVIHHDEKTGLTEIARPVGVVAALTPSTNPAATPANNVINALKGRNAIILAPSPKGAATCNMLLEFIHRELRKVGLPTDLVQQLPLPGSKTLAAELMRQADLVVATGSRANVQAAYKSGKPALGVGAGNVAAIVLPAANPVVAAERIAYSKTFDHATSCSSENSVIAIEPTADVLLAALVDAGGVVITAEEKARLQAILFQESGLNTACIGKGAVHIATLAGLDEARFRSARFLIVEETGAGPAHPFSGEKLSPVLTFYRVGHFDAALDLVTRIYNYQGKGHSVGLHGADEQEALRAATFLPVCRVILDQIHCVATGGASNNGLPFSLSMGCGTWGGNGFSDNLNYRHFLNITRVVRPIAPVETSPSALLGDYWQRYGR
ncbi:acylating sulfoacetaldehyde dehydrogenase [Ectothiorhodospira lacustris]|uniref:acylating sulfoacetaldehyde dehydrogenase n=1 Tax=Ectothiorhodospira lacustris TaxID=2899127 RepID=UPI001EE97325|nr:aldehyde dehydrogenase family protein [Ectothiorhodospira lacustris]MCG5501334.1 aldehyde dehydrogenase family protein [Ectothiorhodospira lacustris]